MSENLRIGLTMLACGLITFLIRLSFLALGERFAPGEGARRALHYVPPAVLCALIAPDVLMPAGSLDISLANTHLLAALCAAVVALASRSVLATVCSGLVALWVLQRWL
ncbi:AzlD domain-containing protein [Niveibacterium sp. SC-1]|uniref:AzlD domain-containing protein n=1 Tax=Niveibacterium sp. SC-1 TaxID=3135646 RepID=UPI00311DF9C9